MELKIRPIASNASRALTIHRPVSSLPWTELDLSRWSLRAEPYLRQFANPFGRMACTG